LTTLGSGRIVEIACWFWGSLMWREESRLGMQAFVNGDCELAIRRWQRSIALAEESRESPGAELAETYYNLGKALADLEKNELAIPYLEKSIHLLEAVAPRHQRLATAKYQLAALLKMEGRESEGNDLFRQSLKLPLKSGRVIPLQKALVALKQCELAQELTGKVLNELCRATGIDFTGDNAAITDLLLAYYGSAVDGGRRQGEDRFFACHYTEFAVPLVLTTLGQLSGLPDLLSLVGTKGSTALSDNDFITVELKSDEGEPVHRAFTSIVGLVDCFNEQLSARNLDLCFYSLTVQDVFCCYLLKESTFQFLAKNQVLPFDDYSFSPVVEEVQSSLEKVVETVVSQNDQTNKYLQQILAIQEVLPKIPVKELPSILIGLRRLRIEAEQSETYEYSPNEEEAFDRLIATFARTVGAAQINREPPLEELSVEVSRFGGRPYAQAQDEWPECPNCSLSLNFVCQISEELHFEDASVHRLLFTLFYCFNCRPKVTADGEGYVLGTYWDAAPHKFVEIRPRTQLSCPTVPYSLSSIWLEPLVYFPSAREVDLSLLGIPEDYYHEQFSRRVEELKGVAQIIGEGPYPDSARFINCQECSEQFETRYTLYLDGTFSILACPNHPDRPLGFHNH
jgi:tetratricopeptide (TPR) repeat protein